MTYKVSSGTLNLCSLTHSRTKFEVSSFKCCKESEKFAKFKSRPRLCLLLTFAVCLHKTSVAVAVLELFTTIRKFLSPCFALLEILYTRNVLIEFEICICSHSGKTDKIPKFKKSQCDSDYSACLLLTYFCTAYFPLITVYLSCKFKPCSFSRSRDFHSCL